MIKVQIMNFYFFYEGVQEVLHVHHGGIEAFMKFLFGLRLG